MQITYAFAGLRVKDRDRAAAWYETLFEKPPTFLPNDIEAVWQLAETASFYVLADPERAGTGLVAVVVDDLDATLATLAGHGIEPTEIEVNPGGRKAIIFDPDGNELGLIGFD